MSNNITDTQVGAVNVFNLSNQQQVYSQIYELVTGTAVKLDFKTLANQNRVSNLQGVYMDNSQGTDPLTVTVDATLQTVSIPAGYQAIMPLYVTADMVVTLTGNGSCPIIFNNFPTPAAVWKAS